MTRKNHPPRKASVIKLTAPVQAPPAPRWIPPTPDVGTGADATVPAPARTPMKLTVPTAAAPAAPGAPAAAAPAAPDAPAAPSAPAAPVAPTEPPVLVLGPARVPAAPVAVSAPEPAAAPEPESKPETKSETKPATKAGAKPTTAPAPAAPQPAAAATTVWPTRKTSAAPEQEPAAAPAPQPSREPAREPATVPAAPAAAAATTARDRRPALPADPRHTAKPGRIRRLPGLDGLRGIAVAAVLIYHFFGDALPGGFLGVDVFFVLSGFLITALLVREYGHNGRISLKKFWQRRARRILPAAATVLVVCTAVAGILGGDAAVNLPPQFLGSLFFVNNWVQISEAHSYFADTTPQIFMHYWSLAIEEQFYVLWPLLFLGAVLLARRMGVRSPATQMRWPAVLATVIGIASLIAMIVLFNPDDDPSRVYFGTDTHAFGLVTGVVLALIVTAPSDLWPDSFPVMVRPRITKMLGWTLAPVAFIALVALIVFLPDTAPFTYRGGLFLASLLTAAVILSVVRERGPVPVLLQWRPLRYLGERSFSLYLWHWPVVVFLLQELQDGPKGQETGVPDWGVGLIAVAVSLVLSELSYRYVETPFRRRGYRGVLDGLGEAKRMLPVPAAALTLTLLAGVALGDSPEHSELEEQLSSISKSQEMQNQAPPPAAGATDPGLPAGQDITAIGDSVMLASAPALYQRFPGITVDAETSRHYTAGAGVIDAMMANGSLGEYVVLGFGTNGQAFDGQLDQIMAQLGPDHKAVLVVPYGHQDPIPTAAQQVIDYAHAHRNVYLAPWCSMISDHPEDLYDDGVHPNDEGGPVYADAVAAGLRAAKAGTQDAAVSCAL